MNGVNAKRIAPVSLLGFASCGSVVKFASQPQQISGDRVSLIADRVCQIPASRREVSEVFWRFHSEVNFALLGGKRFDVDQQHVRG